MKIWGNYMTKLLEVYPDVIDTSKRCIGIGNWHEYTFRILVTDELKIHNEIEIRAAMHVKLVDMSQDHWGENVTEKYCNLIRIEGYQSSPKLITADIIDWM